jgi:hypothetical protein
VLNALALFVVLVVAGAAVGLRRSGWAAVLARAALLVALLLVGEWLYVVSTGDYTDCSGSSCGPAWGFLQALWVTLLVVFGLLLLALIGDAAWRARGRSRAA